MKMKHVMIMAAMLPTVVFAKSDKQLSTEIDRLITCAAYHSTEYPTIYAQEYELTAGVLFHKSKHEKFDATTEKDLFKTSLVKYEHMSDNERAMETYKCRKYVNEVFNENKLGDYVKTLK